MLSPLTGVVDATTPDSEAARKFSWMVKEFLDDAPRYQLYKSELSQMLADLPRAAESLDRLVKRLDSVSADLPETSAQARQTLQRLNRLLAGQQQDIEKTVENLRSISENMKELTDSSVKYPSQVLFGLPPPPSKHRGGSSRTVQHGRPPGPNFCPNFCPSGLT